MKLKKISVILLSAALLLSVGCNRITEETDEDTETTSEEETSESTVEDTSVTTTAETSTAITEPAIDAPVAVDWDNYQKPEEEYVFTRLSEEKLTFEPSEEYGAVFPYLATSSLLEIYVDPESEDAEYYDPLEEYYTTFSDDTYGFCDSKGRIVCDPVFTGVELISDCPVYIIKTGDFSHEKFGLVHIDGTKYIEPKYDRIDYKVNAFFAYSGSNLTVYDMELNVVKQTSVKQSTAYESITVLGFIDDSRCLVGFTDPGFAGVVSIYDYKSGVMLEEVFESEDYTQRLPFMLNGVFDDHNVFINNEDLPIDKYGNTLIDEDASIGSFLETTFCPIFKVGDVYNAIDSDGNVIFESSLASQNCYKCGDYLLLNTEDNVWTLFDRDFNECGSYKAASEVISEDWSGYCLDRSYDRMYKEFLPKMNELEVPYVVDDGNVVNALTGETVIEGPINPSEILVCGDLVAAVCDDNIVFSNGNTYEGIHTRFAMDLGYNVPYVINECSDKYEIYDPIKDTTCVINARTSDVESFFIGGESVYLRYGDISCVYDISDPDDPQMVFRFKSVDPLGE